MRGHGAGRGGVVCVSGLYIGAPPVLANGGGGKGGMNAKQITLSASWPSG